MDTSTLKQTAALLGITLQAEPAELPAAGLSVLGEFLDRLPARPAPEAAPPQAAAEPPA